MLSRRNNDLPPTPDRAIGAYALNTESGEVGTFGAKVVCICAGGAGKVYLYTSNPDIASGDGIAMSWRAGAAIGNMGSFNFIRLACITQKQGNFISEALRGDGGKLRLKNGERFMLRYDDRAELAPRDIVARSIDAELKKRGEDCVYLDMTHLQRSELQNRYPNIYQGCFRLGIDMATTPIPVVPAAHYFCGGAMTDLNGESTVRNPLSSGNRLVLACMVQIVWPATRF